MTDLTSERLAELRRIASAATPGPWRISDDGPADRFVIASAEREHIAETTQGGSFTNEDLANAHHIATFDPATALALLDRIEALEAENERLRQIEAAARTLVDTAFEVPGPDEYVYQAVRVDHFDMLAALLKGEGGATLA